MLVRDLRAALTRLNPDLPQFAREQAVEKLTRIDFARSLLQHNHNLTDYLSEHSIAHAFHHNAFLVVSNGDQARYGSISRLTRSDLRFLAR